VTGLPRPTVFKNRTRLSPRYIPRTLPHREKQLDFLLNMFDDVLEDPSQVYLRPVQVVGGIGTGKTCTTVRFSETLQEKASDRDINLKHVYVNLKLQGNSRTVLYRYLLEKAAPEIRTASLSAGEMLYQLVKYLDSRNMYLIVVLDEIEYFMKNAGEHIIYDLTRVNELSPEKPCRLIGLVVISRGTDYYSLLEKSELSTLGRTYVEFTQYTSEQIRDILAARLEEAFKKGIVQEDVIDFIADVTAAPPVNGDVRYALDLLLYAGNLADSQGAENVRLDHARRVHGEIYHQITSQDILDLSSHEKAVLLAVARALRGKRSTYVSFEDIQKECVRLSEDLSFKLENVDHAIQDLGYRGLVDIKSLVKIGISDAPVEELVKYLDNLMDRVGSELRERKS